MTDKENNGNSDQSKDTQSSGNNDIDWDAKNLIHHPEGMDKAMAANISKMEEQTRKIIESGSIEDIEAALARNLEELAALQKHMEKLTNRDLSQV